MVAEPDVKAKQLEVFKCTSIRRMTTGGNYINLTADVVLASEAATTILQLQNTIDVLQDNQAEYIGTITRLECENIDLTAERDELTHQIGEVKGLGVSWRARAEAAEKELSDCRKRIQELEMELWNI